MADTLKKVLSEPFLIVFLLLTGLLMVTNFEEELGLRLTKIYIWMFTGYIGLYLLHQTGTLRTEIESVPNNSGQSLLFAGIAIVVFLGLFGLVGQITKSVLPVTDEQLSRTFFQTIFQATSTIVDFNKSFYVSLFLFTLWIPLIENAMLIRLYGAIASTTNIRIGDNSDIRNWSLRALLGMAFMFFHLRVFGVNNNIHLIITLFFGMTMLYLVGRFKDMESANYMHIGWNSFAYLFGR